MDFLDFVCTCIGCGCDDWHACWDVATAQPCHWLRTDEVAGLGVCSACPDVVADWDRGDREVRVPVAHGSAHCPVVSELEAAARDRAVVLTAAWQCGLVARRWGLVRDAARAEWLAQHGPDGEALAQFEAGFDEGTAE